MEAHTFTEDWFHYSFCFILYLVCHPLKQEVDETGKSQPLFVTLHHFFGIFLAFCSSKKKIAAAFGKVKTLLAPLKTALVVIIFFLLPQKRDELAGQKKKHEKKQLLKGVAYHHRSLNSSNQNGSWCVHVSEFSWVNFVF